MQHFSAAVCETWKFSTRISAQRDSIFLDAEFSASVAENLVLALYCFRKTGDLLV